MTINVRVPAYAKGGQKDPSRGGQHWAREVTGVKGNVTTGLPLTRGEVYKLRTGSLLMTYDNYVTKQGVLGGASVRLYVVVSTSTTGRKYLGSYELRSMRSDEHEWQRFLADVRAHYDPVFAATRKSVGFTPVDESASAERLRREMTEAYAPETLLPAETHRPSEAERKRVLAAASKRVTDADMELVAELRALPRSRRLAVLVLAADGLKESTR